MARHRWRSRPSARPRPRARRRLPRKRPQSQSAPRLWVSSTSNDHGPPSHILGRPGPGEPSGFLVAPGRAEGVARLALRAVLLVHFARAPARPSSHRLARAHQLILIALRPLRRAPRRYTPLPLSLSLSLSPSSSQPTSACTPAATARPRIAPTASRRASITTTRRLRPPPVSGSHRMRCGAQRGAPERGRGRGAQPEPGALGLARAALAHPRQAQPRGSPRAFSRCRAGPRVWRRARPRARCSAKEPGAHGLARAALAPSSPALTPSRSGPAHPVVF